MNTMKHAPLGGIFALSIALASMLGACSNDDNDPAPPVVGGTQCSADPKVELAPETGAPDNQTVCGRKTTDATKGDLYTFFGIPYADSTAGDNRWLAPQPPQWTGIFNANQYGNRCPQGQDWGDKGLPEDISEDCLFLNVWTPKLTAPDKGDLPVMVFIHGGAFLVGSGGDNVGPGHLYDGTSFVDAARQGENIVFVTLNYRLGALGFLASPELGLNGNFGIQDQQKALQWVQRNISRFGGNPKRVMVFGESAGAQSTALHLTISSSQPLLQNAILESSYAISYMKIDGEALKSKVDWFKESVGCKDKGLDCLRGILVSTIIDAQLLDYTVDSLKCAGLQAVIPWNPVIDGTLITRDPINASITKPMINGTNLNESIPFVGIISDLGESNAGTVYGDLMVFLFGPDNANDIFKIYGSPSVATLGTLEQVVTDYLWTCYNREFATRSTQDVYRYSNIHVGSFPFWVNKDTGLPKGAVDEACQTAVCHAAELPFVFGNPVDNQSLVESFDADEEIMSGALQQYWVQFARSGNPNAQAQANLNWPQNTTGNLLQIPGSAMATVTTKSIAEQANCALWDRIGYTVTSEFKNEFDDQGKCTVGK